MPCYTQLLGFGHGGSFAGKPDITVPAAVAESDGDVQSYSVGTTVGFRGQHLMKKYHGDLRYEFLSRVVYAGLTRRPVFLGAHF